MIADLPGGAVLVAVPKEAGNGAAIGINDTFYENTECRILAVDKAGKTVVGRQFTDLDKAKRLRLSRAEFHGLKLADVAEFRFEVRPYAWVELKGVSLEAGAKTQPKAVVRPNPPVAAAADGILPPTPAASERLVTGRMAAQQPHGQIRPPGPY